MKALCREDLDFTVEGVPGVKEVTRPAPSSLALDVAEILAGVQKTRFGDWHAAHFGCSVRNVGERRMGKLTKG